MHYSAFSRLRDILLLCTLCFLVKTAFERTTSFISEHKNSIVHELDRTFIDEIYTAQRQLHYLKENYYLDNDEHTHIITDLLEKLNIIEEKYKKNSPGLMILGPIGSAAIIAKEEKLQKKLLDITNETNKLLLTLKNKSHEFQALDTINAALKGNKKLLKELVS